MKRYLSLIVVILLASACAGKRQSAEDISMHDGSSFEKAVIINETNQHEGIDDEYAWIRENYPAAKHDSQELIYHDKKPYDVLHITTMYGKSVAVYFDISKFFGKL